jgi:NADH dehydrogenase [ubiquinone] 1 alpha subcomplex assembly factor 6
VLEKMFHTARRCLLRARRPPWRASSPSSPFSTSTGAASAGGSASGSAAGDDAARDDAECERLVKTFDYEHYLSLMFLAPARRRAALAVRAYNVELATVRDSARGNALTGRIRFQFWREILEEIYAAGRAGGAPGEGARVHHPVGRALARAVRDHGLQRRWLDRMLVAREQELDNVEFGDMGDFEEYAEAVGGSMMYLVLECATDANSGGGGGGGGPSGAMSRGGGGGCGQGPFDAQLNTPSANAAGEDAAYMAAGHVGRAATMVTMLRSVPHTAENSQRFTLPFWVMSKHSVRREDFLTGQSTAEMRDCVLEVATVANNQLIDVREMQGGVDEATSRALLPATLAQDYLKRLEGCDFDVFDPSLIRSRVDNVKLMVQLWRLQSQGKLMAD